MFASLDVSKSYRILGLFPHPGISHFHFFQPVMKSLAEAGHEVVVVSHFPEKAPSENYKDIPLSGLTALVDIFDLDMFKWRPSFFHFMEFTMLHKVGLENCENALNSSAIKTVLNMGRREGFDLVIVEQWNNDCMMGIAHKLGAPVIGLSSCALMPWQYGRSGAPLITSYMPALFLGYTEKMNFMERIGNWITAHGMRLLYEYFTQPKTDKLLQRRFGDDIPKVAELVKKTSLVFVNQHFSMSLPKPLPPEIVELGGIHIGRPKPLEPEMQTLLDSAEHGVIYISWGSMIRAHTLPDDKREAIVHAIGKFKQLVLWKWENETLTNQPANLHIRKWMPQREILCHPNVKVFVTHGGLLGSSEAAYCGVPVVATPMYGDQHLNSAAMVYRGMGVLLPYENINRDTVYEAIRKALQPRTKENAEKVSFAYKNRPMAPSKSAVFWAEYVIETNGAPFAKSAAAHLPWYIYWNLDIYITILTVMGFFIWTWIYIWRLVFGNKKTKVTTKSTTQNRPPSNERKVKSS
jgi:glucuronosyltransferase